jgi:TolB-like protein/DNA-binding SARP family transcriptional activator
VIISRGSAGLGVSLDALWCDAVVFEQALKRNELAEALLLYKADILPAFYVDAAMEFEHWLDEERSRLRRSASVAAWTLSTQAEEVGDFASACNWAHFASQLAPGDESALRQLLGVLFRAGDNVGASVAYESFAARLATEYEEELSRETIEFFAKSRSRKSAQKLSIHLDEQSELAGEKRVEVAEHSTDSTKKISRNTTPLTHIRPVKSDWSKHVSRLRWTAISVVLVIIAGAFSLIRPGSKLVSVNDERAIVVVGGFRELYHTPDSTNLTQALAAAIVHRLAEVNSLIVSEALTARQEHILLTSDQNVLQLSVAGTIVRAGLRTSVNIEIADMKSGRIVKATRFEHSSNDPRSLTDTLSLQISSLIRTVVGREKALVQRNGSKQTKRAYRLMQAADNENELANELETSGSVPAFATALHEEDSTLAILETIAPAWIEPRIDHAHVLQRLAVLYLLPPSRDSMRVRQLLSQGITEAERAVSIDSTNSSALDVLGSASYWYWLVVPVPVNSATQIRSRAESSLVKAVHMNPEQSDSWSLLSMVFYSRADYVNAYIAANKAYYADTYLNGTQEILDGLFLYAYEVGDDSASARWCEELNRRSGKNWTGAFCRLRQLAWSNAKGHGVVHEAWGILNSVDTDSPSSLPIKPQLQLLVASILATNGLRDSAESIVRRVHQVANAEDELLPLEADARIRLGQDQEAAALLMRYLNADPNHRVGVIRSRRFAKLAALQARLAQLHVASRAKSN